MIFYSRKLEGLTVVQEIIITLSKWATFTGEKNNNALSKQKEEKEDTV